jgi:hypothetical protein
MACEIATFGKVMFVLWGEPERQDFATIAAQARALYDARGPFVFIARVPAGAEAPRDSIRQDVSRCMSFLFERCASYHGVLEGTGFKTSAKRAVVATLLLMMRQRHKLYVHATVAEAASAVHPELRGDVEAALRWFEPRGLLNRNLASIAAPPPSFTESSPRRAARL